MLPPTPPSLLRFPLLHPLLALLLTRLALRSPLPVELVRAQTPLALPLARLALRNPLSVELVRARTPLALPLARLALRSPSHIRLVRALTPLALLLTRMALRSLELATARMRLMFYMHHSSTALWER